MRSSAPKKRKIPNRSRRIKSPRQYGLVETKKDARERVTRNERQKLKNLLNQELTKEVKRQSKGNNEPRISYYIPPPTEKIKKPRIKKTPEPISKNENVLKYNIKKLKKLSYPEFLKSDYWKFVRNVVLKRDGNKCCECGSKQRLDVHHKTYKHHFAEHKNLNDLITLCRDCHKNEHEIL